MVWAIWTVRYGADTKTKSASHFYEKSHPVGIWCQNDVVSTLMQRNHVAST